MTCKSAHEIISGAEVMGWVGRDSKQEISREGGLNLACEEKAGRRGARGDRDRPDSRLRPPAWGWGASFGPFPCRLGDGQVRRSHVPALCSFTFTLPRSPPPEPVLITAMGLLC